MNDDFVFSMIRIQKRIADGMAVLQFFTMRRWEFREVNYRGIMEHLQGDDRKV